MKKKHYLLAGLLAILTIVWLFVEQGGTMKAAPQYKIKFSSESAAGTQAYVMKRKSITATYTDENNETPPSSSITWSVDNTSVITIVGDNDKPNVELQAKGAGEVDLTATIITDTGQTTTTRTIIVGYALDENPNNGFTLNEKLSNDSIMSLEIGEFGTLEFIFPATSAVNWKSGDSKVVSMDMNDYVAENTTGYFRAVHAGKTTITALYKNGEGKLESVSVNVYVGPEIKYGTTIVTETVTVENGDPISVGAYVESDSNKIITDRIEWVVKNKERTEILGSSLTTPKILIAKSNSNSYLTVDARAGEYRADIYTVGVYSKGVEDDTKLLKSFALKVKAECRDYINNDSIYLQINDSYDIAKVFNMTPEDFEECFDISPENNATKKYDDGDGKGVITAISAGKQNILITLKAGKTEKLRTLMDDATIPDGKIYNLELNIYESFRLDRSTVDLALGGTLKLETLYPSKGKITWKSANDDYVTVDQNGIIKGEKVTNTPIEVTAAMELNGRTLKASCMVTVHDTAEIIQLTETNIRLQTGQSNTITAMIIEPSGLTSIPGLKWILTDDTVVSLDVISDMSVVVTADKAGTTILTAVNEDNFVSAYCTITVLAPIEEINLDAEEMTLKLSQEAVKLHATYNSDATDLRLKWSSSKPSVATVDETGFVELKGAGTTIITVMPEWNQKNIMAQCRITVLQSATAFALDKAEITLEVGEKGTLSPAVTPNNATVDITWKSLNSKVATVNNGVVTAVAAGQAYIVANTENGYVDNCLVTVTQKATGVKLDVYNITVNVGESYTVTASPNPTTSTETKFTWTSKDPSVATVKDGTVMGVSAGSTIILIKTKSGSVDYLYVTVKDKAKGMELNYSTKQVAKGSSFTLKPIFTPTNTTNKNVTWKSSNTGVAKVSEEGKVTGVKGGSAIITAVSEDGGYVANCLVTVVQPVSKVKLNYSSYKLGLGKTVTLKATVTSNTSSNPKIKWTSSNTKIATVTSTGKVRAKKLGSCTITAKVTDGSGQKATCKITVVRQATSININKSYLTLTTGKNYKLKATVKPKNATYKTVNWSSTDTGIAMVDKSGLVRGISVGSCNIKASAKDNSKKSATCYVEIIDPISATSIITDKNMIMIRGESQMLNYSIVPSNSTDSVKITSGNKNIATVSSSGKVYARRAGATSITITADSGKQAIIQLQVIGLNKTSITLEQYDTENLQIDGVSSGVTWYSANPSVATVSGGKVVGRKKGTTYIYAKVNGITLGCKVKVKDIS